MDTTRRGILGTVMAAAAAVRAPAEAVKSSLLAEAAKGLSGPDACAETMYLPDYTSLQTIITKDLEGMSWGEGVDPNPMIRANLDCFRSASQAAKITWEMSMRKKEAHNRKLARVALDLLTSGKFKI